MSQEFATWLWEAMRTAGYPPEPDRRLAGRTKFAAAAGVSLSTVTRALDIGRVPEPDILRKLAPALHRPVIELFVVAGYLTAEEAGIEEEIPAAPAVATVSEAIRQDDALIDEARAHLLNQYELLRRLSDVAGSQDSNSRRAQPSPAGERPLRAVARKRPTRKP